MSDHLKFYAPDEEGHPDAPANRPVSVSRSTPSTAPTLDQIVNDEVPVYVAQDAKVRAVVEGVWQAFEDRDYREPSISPKELMDVLEAVMAKEQA